jgi:hypothetical protein
MNKEELRQLTESYYYDVYDYETIDEANKAEREFKLNPSEQLAVRNSPGPATMFRFMPKDPKSPKRFRAKGTLHAAEQQDRQKEHEDRRGKKKATPSGSRYKPSTQAESYDLYDVVLEHLLAEGYADDTRSAEVIMANMSDEWLGDILDEASRTETIRNRYEGRYGRPESGDTLRLHVARKKYEDAAEAHSRDSRNNPHPNMGPEGKQTKGQAMYKAGQSKRSMNG